MRILFWPAITTLTVMSVIFTIHNQTDISLDLWPFPYLITLPLNLFVIGLSFCSILFGAGLVSIAHIALHQKLFKMKRQNQKMAQSQQALQTQLTEAENRLLALQITDPQFSAPSPSAIPPLTLSSSTQTPSLIGPF